MSDLIRGPHLGHHTSLFVALACLEIDERHHLYNLDQKISYLFFFCLIRNPRVSLVGMDILIGENGNFAQTRTAP